MQTTGRLTPNSDEMKDDGSDDRPKPKEIERVEHVLLSLALFNGIPLKSKKSDDTKKQKAKARVSHSYVLPSGEVVASGKGLGRGRPGIKRGPSKPKNPNPSATQPPSRKRKRSDVGLEKKPARRATTSSFTDSESEDEYAPEPTQTRSGRNTQRPSTFVPESPSHKKARPNPAAPALGKRVIKPKTYKGKDKNALCEHCSRGYGPPKNLIVFCDACNRCWHQKCHDPLIPRKVTLDMRSEWFCSRCTEIMGEGKKENTEQAVEESQPTVEDSPLTVAASSKIAQVAQKAYYSTLDKDSLIDILLQASALAPDLTVWPEIPPLSPSVATSTTTAPMTKPTLTQELTLSSPNPPAPQSTNDTAQDDDLFDEHARLYPRPGNGVQLPPESEDMQMLLEGPGCRTFSHRVFGIMQRVGVAG